MSAPLTICLGKNGDILTLLPLLRKEAVAEPVPLMVSKRYAPLVEGVSYVKPLVFDGEAHELDRAFAEAAKMSSNLRVCQVCGPKELIKRYVLDRNKDVKEGKMLGDSFQKSIWQLCGHWGDFTKGWPLVFDKRSEEREQKLIEKYVWTTEKSRTKAKILLVSTGRQPNVKTDAGHFKLKSLLTLVLDLALKRGWRIIDLDSIVADRFYDLLALYENASMLVATDNAPLHLAYAVPKLPVCALISDKPTLWNGSAWRPNHLFHCRYGDFPERVREMLDVFETMGQHGDPFWSRKIQGPKNVHVWSQYEVTNDNMERHLEASLNWRSRYHRDGNWISCKIDRGAFGRDSESMKMEGGRYPYVKDMLRAAAQRSKDGDTIVITRADTCFSDNPIKAGFSHRIVKSSDGDTFSPWIDLLAFQRNTLDRIGELPDLIMGPDLYWSDVLREWAKVDEVDDLCWRKEQ